MEHTSQRDDITAVLSASTIHVTVVPDLEIYLHASVTVTSSRIYLDARFDSDCVDSNLEIATRATNS